MLEKGILYGYGRDAKMRPILILNVRKLIDAGLDPANCFDFVDFFMSYIVQNALVPGRVEQYSLIIDFRDVALTEIPVQSIVSMISRSTTLYKHRSCQTLVVGVGWIIRVAVKFVYNFMDAFQLEKFVVYGDVFADEFDEKIGLENLEEKYGGELANVEANFFPPLLNIFE